ncbi:MAG: type I-MYXAN CRISPR-associated Cas8a1/Cmx1 [Cyanobacteria bacterium P01_E01_bin.42]
MDTTPKGKPRRSLELSLWDAFNTPLHRAGLAGLYLTLESLEADRGKIIDWQLGEDAIALSWDCSDREALTWLLEQTYRVDGDELISIPALSIDDMGLKVFLHNGILSTFLQHGQSRTKTSKQNRSISLDENTQKEIEYTGLATYNFRDLKPYTKKGLYDKQDNFRPFVAIKGWLYPGAAEKHVAVSGTSWEESSEGFFCLLFAPIACGYYQIKSRLQTTKYKWALIIPHIKDLTAFARAYRRSGFSSFRYYRDTYVTGLPDASLYHLVQLVGDEAIAQHSLDSCEVWTFGTMPWSEKQKSITRRERVRLNAQLRSLYKICSNRLKNGVKVGKKGAWVDVSFGREIVTENLLAGRAWYSRFHEVLRFKSETFEQLYYESGGLHNMKELTIEKGLTEDMATLFSDAVTWQIYKKRQQAGSVASDKPNYDKVKTDFLMSIRSCRTQKSFNHLFLKIFGNPASLYNPFVEGENFVQLQAWSKQNWQDCLSLIVLAVIGYRNPWLVPRTYKKLVKIWREKNENSKEKQWKIPQYAIDKMGVIDPDAIASDELEDSPEYHEDVDADTDDEDIDI